jgi:hypothetical protein
MTTRLGGRLARYAGKAVVDGAVPRRSAHRYCARKFEIPFRRDRSQDVPWLASIACASSTLTLERRYSRQLVAIEATSSNLFKVSTVGNKRQKFKCCRVATRDVDIGEERDPPARHDQRLA